MMIELFEMEERQNRPIVDVVGGEKSANWPRRFDDVKHGIGHRRLMLAGMKVMRTTSGSREEQRSQPDK